MLLRPRLQRRATAPRTNLHQWHHHERGQCFWWRATPNESAIAFNGTNTGGNNIAGTLVTNTITNASTPASMPSRTQAR